MNLFSTALLIILGVAPHAPAAVTPGRPAPAAAQSHTHRRKPARRPQPRGRRVLDLDTFVRALRARGLKVEDAGQVSQPFFSPEGRAFSVGGENVQVFRYRTAEAARKEAALVSPDGSSVGTSMMSWMSTPHFYRKENLIVLYVGEREEVLRALQSALGARFAGG